MTKTQLLATEIREDMSSDGVRTSGIATALIILQIIMFIIGSFKNRYSSGADVRKKINGLNLIQRFLLKYKVNSYMKNNSEEFDIYNMNKDEYFNRVFDKLKIVSDEVVEEN